MTTKFMTRLMACLAVGIATSFVFIGKVSAGEQRSKTDEIRKKIEDLERKKGLKAKDVTEQEEKLAKRREALQKEFETVHSQASLDEIGAFIVKSVAAQKSNPGDSEKRAETGLTEIEKDVRSKMGGTLYDAARTELLTLLKTMIDESDEPSLNRAVRYLADHYENAFRSKVFEEAWPRTFAAKLSTDLDSAKTQVAEIERQIENYRSQLTSGIGGNIPRNMVAVPAASDVTLGMEVKEVETLVRERDEKPSKYHYANTGKVKTSVEAFLIEQFEVSQAAYWYFCQQTGKKGPVDTKGVPLFPDDKIPPGWEKRPITCITLEDAMEYAEWAHLRLPTEDEWEVAARSGKNGYDSRMWAWGNTYSDEKCNDDKSVNFPARRAIGITVAIPEVKLDGKIGTKVDVPGTTPIGSFPQGASPLGIYDLNGNAAEWTTSIFKPRPTFKKVSVDNTTLDIPDFDADKVVVRGGTYNHNSLFVASFSRNPLEPRAWHKSIGFRCVRSAVPGKDFLEAQIGGSRLDSRLSDFTKKTKADTAAQRIFPEIDRTTGRYAIVEKLEWNEELDVRGKASAIFIANRKSEEVATEGDLRDFSKGERDVADSFLLGLFYTDVPLTKPALPAGTYFVAYKGGYKLKSEDKKAPPLVFNDCILIIPAKAGEAPIRWEELGSSIISAKGDLKSNIEVVCNAANEKATADKLTLVYSYGIRQSSSNSLQVILNFEAEKGALKNFE